MAYTSDDLFGGNNLVDDLNDLDNLVEFGDRGFNSDEEQRNGGADDEAEENGNEGDDKKKDGDQKPDEKKVKVRRPQPKLDIERLRGPRGFRELKKTFADMKFQGKGHEAKDLQHTMARLEHWAHRLFPKLQFDDFIEKMEKLGSKKIVQCYVKKMRMGMDEDDDALITRLEEEEADNPDAPADEAMGEFDRLLAEQVSLHDTSIPRTPATPALARTQAATSTPVPSLTPEQRARIEANRLAAMERRRTRAALAAQRAQQPDEEPQAPAAPGRPGRRRDSVAQEASDDDTAPRAPDSDAVDVGILDAVAAADAAEAEVPGADAVPDVVPAPNAVPDVVPASELPGDIADVEVAPLGVAAEPEAQPEADSVRPDLCLSESSSSSGDVGVGGVKRPSQHEAPPKRRAQSDEDSVSWSLASFMSAEPQQKADEPDDQDVGEVEVK